MLTLRADQICPYSNTCKHNKNDQNNFCHGSVKRDRRFTCDFVDDNGNLIEEGGFRSKLDLTGKMKILTEDQN